MFLKNTILIATLFVSALTGFCMAETKVKFQVTKTETSYQDGNTGMLRHRTTYSATGLDEIQKIIHRSHPGLLPFPQIWGVVEMAPRDYLLILSRDSQGPPYPIIRVQDGD